MPDVDEPRPRTRSGPTTRRRPRYPEENIAGRKTVVSRRSPWLSSQRLTAIAGALLVLVAILWLGWLLLPRLANTVGISLGPFPGMPSTPTPEISLSPLAAAGVSVGHASQTPALTEQQALYLASQLEPDASAHAQKTAALYVLLNYAPASTAATPRTTLTSVPAWMIVYQQVALRPSDPSADPASSTATRHDLYVFLDANTGKELLVIWA